MPFFFPVVFAVFLASSSAASAGYASFDSSIPSLSLEVSPFNLLDSLEILPGFIESVSSQEFSSLPARVNFSTSQSVEVRPVSSGLLVSAAGGLAMRIDDGCSDPDHGGRDKCELAGFTGPGDFAYCSPCDYFHPQCGNLYYHDWCYRFRPIPVGNHSSNASTSNFSFNVSILLGNASCTVSPSLNCSEDGLSAAISGFHVNDSLIRLTFVGTAAGSWQPVPPQALSSYLSVLSSFDSRYTVSIPEAAAATAELNLALSTLFQQASGNYSPPFSMPLQDQAVFPSISLSLSQPAFNLTAIHGRPRFLPANSSPQPNGSAYFFALPLHNSGRLSDSFLTNVSCNDSSVHLFRTVLNASEASVLEIPAPTASPPRSCTVFSFTEGAPLLNDSADVLLDAVILQCPEFYPCCGSPEFEQRPCPPAEMFNSSGGFYYLQNFACVDFSCTESGTTFLRFPPSPPSSGQSGSSGYFSSPSLVGPGAPSPSNEPSSLPSPAAPASPSSPLVFTSVGAFSVESASPPTPKAPPFPTAIPIAMQSSPSSTSALVLLDPQSLRIAAVFASCAFAAAIAFSVFRPGVSLSKRFANGEVLLRATNRGGALSAVLLSDFVPADAVFPLPPASLSDTVLGRLAEWRASELPQGSFFEVRYSCASPAPRPASLSFTHSGRRFSLKSARPNP
ncbi:MAG: hypothetical protein V1787_04275 [Candidatus Micrarchaeota archaeon]